MAKRTRTTTSSHYSTVQVCSFWSLVLAGVAGLIAFTIKLLQLVHVDISWWGRVGSICSLIATVAFFISVSLAAWDFVKFKTKGWRVTFWIFFVLALLGLVGLGIGTWL